MQRKPEFALSKLKQPRPPKQDDTLSYEEMIMLPRHCPIFRHAWTPLTVIGLVSVFLLQAGCGRIILTHPSASELLDRSGFSWDSDSTEHFDVLYETASMTAKCTAAFGVESEQAREQVLSFLEEDQYDERVSIFLVESKERMAD